MSDQCQYKKGHLHASAPSFRWKARDFSGFCPNKHQLRPIQKVMAEFLAVAGQHRHQFAVARLQRGSLSTSTTSSSNGKLPAALAGPRACHRTGGSSRAHRPSAGAALVAIQLERNEHSAIRRAAPAARRSALSRTAPISLVELLHRFHVLIVDRQESHRRGECRRVPPRPCTSSTSTPPRQSCSSLRCSAVRSDRAQAQALLQLRRGFLPLRRFAPRACPPAIPPRSPRRPWLALCARPAPSTLAAGLGRRRPGAADRSEVFTGLPSNFRITSLGLDAGLVRRAAFLDRDSPARPAAWPSRTNRPAPWSPPGSPRRSGRALTLPLRLAAGLRYPSPRRSGSRKTSPMKPPVRL